MAAQRFGGKYSPDGARAGQPGSGQPGSGQGSALPPIPRAAPGAEKPAGGWRATLLFLSAFIFLFPAFGEEPGAMLLSLAAGGLLILASLMISTLIWARLDNPYVWIVMLVTAGFGR